MQIIFYTGFDKKRNSCKVPAAGATSRTLTGTLKEPCSVMNPVVLVKRPTGDGVPDDYNYAYIAVFMRYYFVRDVTWNNGMWEISMEVDVLASHRTAIGASSHYVLRTDNSTNDWDPMITDTMYPATNDVSLYQYAMPSGFVNAISSGIYVVGIISGNNASAVGAISYYAMTASEFGALKAALLTDANLETMGLETSGTWNITDMSKELFKTMYNPYQYIASCMWFPVGKGALTTTPVSTIKIGWWDYPLSGDLINAQYVNLGEGPGSIHAHPQAATRGDYLNYAPYTKCTLFGRFGTIPIDLSFFDQDDDAITLTYGLDLITGQCRVRVASYKSGVTPANYHYLAERDFLAGVPIQLAQIGVDYLGAAVTAVDAVANTAQNAFTLNIGGAISSAAHGIYNSLNASMPQMATSGTNGSFLVINDLLDTTLTFQHFTIVDEDISHRGRPLCKIKQINTLSGYILCSDGEFDISCLDEERNMITDYLTSGFFWE